MKERMDTPLVSLITPCYNGAAHMRPYLDGVLSQTYENVQYIFVNDGSTDETEEFILSAKPVIEAKGWEFVYIRQENAGQAAAVNAALGEVRGKYFSQIDSDDILHPEFLRKYCDFLIKNPEYKFCYARVAAKHEDALEKEPCEIWYRHIEDGKPDELFKDLIEQKNVPPLAFYMMETKAFFDVVELPLFISKGGQNWQILLPMAYHYKCGYMNDVLATCVMRDASHSRAKSDASDRQDALKRIQFNTISRIAMPDGEKAFYYDKITRKYLNAAPGNYTVKLFNFIPFLNIRRKKEEAVLRLFDLLPVAVIRERACLPPPPPKLRSCVRLYFDMYPNFGDMLNIELMKFFGLTVKSAEKFDADAIFIGSLLSRFTEGKKRFFPRTVKVWGAGFGRPPVGKRETLRRPLELHAVRGEISLERLRKIADGELRHVAVGDPGLLASRLIDASKIAKKYKLGIVPHYADKDNPLLGKIKIADSHILDIQQNPLDFLFQLAECENVLSSALHGLIAADSLGIPNMRMIMSDAVIGGDYKFDDYYSAFGLTTHPRVDLRCAAEFTELASIREQYGITPEMVANICSSLLNAFPYKP